MQCNQSFCGNGFTNVPQVPFYSSPLQCNQNVYPEIVGEGEVTSVTLPDGTVQFFFMPTVKWWSTGPVQCQPTYATPANPMFANMNNYGNPCNNNMGSWFIRSVSNPLSQNVFNPPCNRNDQSKSGFTSDYNMNCVNNGYHVKFHNDNCTSTTDLHYFYPCLRQDGFRSPFKGTAAVQINTLPVNNTTCHYEVVCTKPCNCCAQPMSLESLVEPKVISQNNAASTDCSCDDLKKNIDVQAKKQKKNKRPTNNICACACESTDKTTSVDKSITTYADQCISCIPISGRETQTSKKDKTSWFKKVSRKTSNDKNKQAHILLNTDSVYQRCNGNDAELWKPVTPMSKKAMEVKSSELLLASGSEMTGCDSDCSSCSGSLV